MKNFLIILAVVIILLFGGVWWSRSMQSSDPTIISRSGLHWHPVLAIYVNDEKQEMPSNVGIGPGRMDPVHTHEPDGTIHLEFQGLVRKDDLLLNKFFEAWIRDMNSFGQNLRMTVNGIENTELGDYEMKDGDKIELRYE